MLEPSFETESEIVDRMCNSGDDLKPKPLLFYSYMERVLNEEFDRVKPQYPMEVNIPKSNKYLLQGDFTPDYKIKLYEPPRLSSGAPVWFSSTLKGGYYRFGYENMDARKISKIPFNSEFIHAIIGGSTGHGKSVTVNSMIGALVHEYAPWELELHLSDAKIVEFKKYGVGHRIPHISSIAATEDPDYVISVLQRGVDQMNERNKIFGSLGCSNLSEFRKRTGLVLPRVIIVMDEVQSTFRLAGRRAAVIGSLIDDYARLGRSAGYHLFMASQGLPADIPSSAVGQLRIRCCLGADEKTSEALLGNDGATNNFGHIGRLIVNTAVLNGGNTEPHNITFQTPFLSDDKFNGLMEFQETLGKKLNYKKVMSFYDEADIKTLEQFSDITSKVYSRMKAEGEVSETLSAISLGYPSFVSEDKDGLLKIYLDGKDVENILICSNSIERTSAHLYNVTKGLSDAGYKTQAFLTDDDLKKYIYNPMTNISVRNAEEQPLSGIGGLVKKRLFLLEIDKLSPGANYDIRKAEQVFDSVGIPKERSCNTLLYQRLVVYEQLKKDKLWEEAVRALPTFLHVYKEYEKMNCLLRACTASDFVRAAFVVGDLSKILGYGRDQKSKCVSYLKKTLQDSCLTNCLFILCTKSMDGLNELGSGLRYTIFDLPDVRDWGRMRTEAPASLPGNLCVLFDPSDSENQQKKFKRTLLKPAI